MNDDFWPELAPPIQPSGALEPRSISSERPEPETHDIYKMLSKPDRHPLAMSRRTFLAAAAATGAVASLPWWMNERVARAIQPLGANEGVLVVILLAGGNDGLNTVVPYADPNYVPLRGALAIPANTVLPLNNAVGLHPNLKDIKGMWDAGKVAVVQGVEYANPTLSHFDSMAIWMAGHANRSYQASGWLGRYLDSLPSGNDAFYGINIGTDVPLHMRGVQRSATGMPGYLSGAFGADRHDPNDARMFDTIKAFSNPPSPRGVWADALARSGSDTMMVGAQVAPAYQGLPGGDLVNDLTLAARLINADLGIRVIAVTNGCFDTHANQLNDHARLLTDFNDGVRAFDANLGDNFRSRVTLLTFSEFGRRAEFNGSGTDHGTSSVQFVIGDMVRGGLYGTYPSLGALDRNGDLAVTADFKTVYATMLDYWLKADADSILGGHFDRINLFTGAPGSVTFGNGLPLHLGDYAAPGGYWTVTDNGQVTAFGNVAHLGNAPAGTKIVAMAAKRDHTGYWLTSDTGAVYSFGSALYYGGMNGTRLNAPIVSMTATPSGKGYWMLGSDGGVFCFGDAQFYGSTGGMRLNAPALAMSPTTDGKGYWFVAGDGGIFTFGKAKFYGSTGSWKLNKPVVGMSPTPTGKGYWLVASDGGIFCFGDAQFYGSTGSIKLNKPIIGMAPEPKGAGYWLIASDGGVFTFGKADFYGSLASYGVKVVSLGV